MPCYNGRHAGITRRASITWDVGITRHAGNTRMSALHGMPDTVSFLMPAIGVKLLIGMKYRRCCFEIKLSYFNFLTTTIFFKFSI
jgi:hypothetical protein